MRTKGSERQVQWHSLPSDVDLSEAHLLKDREVTTQREVSSESSDREDVLSKMEPFTVLEHQDEELQEESNINIFEPQRRREPRGPLDRIRRICTRFPVRDPSWITASCFTFGSAVLVVNSFFLLLPRIAPELNFVGEVTYFAPITSIVGTVMFVMGSSAGILEALNFNRLETESVWSKCRSEDDDDDEKGLMDEENQKMEGLEHFDADDDEREELSTSGTKMATLPAVIGSKAFVWLPSLRDLLFYYLRSPMFLAAIIHLTGAVIFVIEAITSIPGVVNLENRALVDSLLLFPATMGGLCFLVAASLQIISIQPHWYMPCPRRLRWHVAFWGVVGSIGFSLSGGLPFIGTQAADVQATFAGFWGSWCFMLGSALQWYVVMADYP